MAVYGIGCTYDGGDVSSDFVNGGIACIGWEHSEKQYFHGTFTEIDVGDIIVLKTFIRQSQILRIKAIGRVVDTSIQEVNNLGRCISVKWLSYESDGIQDIELTGDGGVQRGTTIYREYNPTLCQEIEEMAERLERQS